MIFGRRVTIHYKGELQTVIENDCARVLEGELYTSAIAGRFRTAKPHSADRISIILMQYETHHSIRRWARYSMRNVLFIVMCFVPWLGSAFPSEEQFVPWGNVDITCPDISGSGIVRFRAKAESFRVVSVSVEAFGRQYTLSDDQIRQIGDFPLSSLSITHEGGYKELGGHTVHFKFRRMFYDASKELRDERLVISFPKESEIRIFRGRTVRTR